MPNRVLPPWACVSWGDYEHDWIDCVECNVSYETCLEEGEFYDFVKIVKDVT